MLASLLFGGAVHAARVGLMTNFVDIAMDFVQPGQDYLVANRNGSELTLTNPGERPMLIAVGAEVPKKKFLKPGYEPIPDPSWVSVSPQEFRLEAGETKALKVALKVPPDPRWKGRHFQVSFWSRSVRGGMGAGVRSRLRFSVDTSRPSEETTADAGAGISFDPAIVRIGQVPLAPPDGLGPSAAVLLSNRGSEAVRVSLRSVRFEDWKELPAGYVPAPNPDFLKLQHPILEIPAGETRSVSLSFHLPPGNAHRGRRYAFLLKAETSSPSAKTAYARAYVEVAR